MKKQGYNPYLPSWEYIPDGIQAIYITFTGQGSASLAYFTLE